MYLNNNMPVGTALKGTHITHQESFLLTLKNTRGKTPRLSAPTCHAIGLLRGGMKKADVVRVINHNACKVKHLIKCYRET